MNKKVTIFLAGMAALLVIAAVTTGPGSISSMFKLSGSGTNVVSYLTNVVETVTSENTNKLYVTGAGTNAANGEYTFKQNAFTSGWIYTNGTGVGFVCKDLSGPDLITGLQNPFYMGFTTNNDDTCWYFSPFDVRVFWQTNNTDYGSYAGVPPAPTVRYGTNTTYTTNTVLVVAGMIRQLRANNTLYVDATNGNDAVASASLCPYKTLTAAKNAATNGWTILVAPGAYNENDLLKNGVNWHFMQGAICGYEEKIYHSATTGKSLFDDRFTGAVTSNIEGDILRFVSESTSLASPIVVTNPNTVLKMRFNQGDYTFYHTYSGTILPGMPTATSWRGEFASIINCNRVDINITDVGTFGTNRTLIDNNPSQVGTYGQLVSWPAQSGGVYWDRGDTHFTCNSLNASNAFYAEWSDTGSVNTNETSLYFTANTVQGLLYPASTSTVSRTWFNITDLKGELRCYGVGRYYYSGQKIGTVGSQCVNVNNNDARLWLNVQKLSSDTRWLNMAAGNSFIDVLQFEETGTMTDGILLSGGTNYIRGLRASGTNASLVKFTGGKAIIDGLRVDGTGKTNPPVVVSANGLFLKDMSLISGGTNAIYSATAKNVGVQNVMANITNHANITLQPNGGFTADANLQ